MRRETFHRRPLKLALAATLVTLGALVAVFLARPSSGDADEPRPRRVSAFTSLPPASSVPPNVKNWAAVASRHVGLSPGDATARVRLLRSNLGGRKAGAYGFVKPNGGYCVLLVGDSGTCSDADHLAKSGIQWSIGGGLPGAPSTLFALVTDDVMDVDLVVDDEPVAVSVANNVAYAEFSADSSDAVIRVTYASGNTHESRVQLGGDAPSLSDFRDVSP